MPQDISGKIGNFSHLFSNVFRIVKDDQENPAPFQLANISSESTADTQNELLKVSLLSDSKINLDNQNISLIVTAFLSKLNSGEFAEALPDTEKLKVDAKIPKYFSLSKDEFIKEIKSIIDTLKNGDLKNLENVEISLIANGQSIKINPLTANVVDLENWVTEQFQSNPDFEILVKSEQKKLAIDVEHIKNETIKSDKPVEIISVITEKNIESETKPISVKNVVEPVSGLKITSTEGSAFEQPITDLKQTYVNVNGEIVKPVNQTLQNPANLVHKNDSQPSLSKNITNDKSIKVELINPEKTGVELHSEVAGKIKPEQSESMNNNLTNTKKVETQNISSGTFDLKNKIVSETLSELNPKPETLFKNEKNSSVSSSLNLKKTEPEKSFDTSIKNLNTEVKVRSNVLQTDELLKSTETVKQSSEVNVKNESHADTKISVKANHKINMISLNKNDIKEKVALNELIEKTNVKSVEVNVQKNTKATNVSVPKIQDEYQQDTTSLKDNTSKVQSPVLNSEVKKVLLTNPESNQPTIKKDYESGNIKVADVKSEKPVSVTLEEKPIVIKTEVITKVIDTPKLQSEPKLKVQQEYLSEKVLSGTEKNVLPKNEFAGIQKIELTKNELLKPINNNQPTPKENAAFASDEKIISGKNNIEQNKTVLNESNKAKFEAIVNPFSKRIVPPETKNELPTIDLKTNSQINENKKLEVEPNNYSKSVSKENVKESVVPKSNVQLVDDSTEELFSNKTVKENVSEAATPKTKSNFINKPSEKSEFNSTSESEIANTNQKEKAVVENLRTGLKEFVSDESKQNSVNQNQVNNKTVKENVLETTTLNTKPNFINKPSDKSEFTSTPKSEIANSNQKEKTIVESLRTGLKEFVSDESKQNSVNQNQVNNNTVKVDFMQRRVYSQIPPLEVIANEAEVKNVKNSVLNVESNDGKNVQSLDEPLKSTSNSIEQKPKNEKQVWVKVSLEKNENEVLGENKKPSLSHNKITIDASRDGMKKDSDQNNYSEKELREYAKPKPQTVSVETSQNTEVKDITQNQSTPIQQDLTAGLKSEIKIENNIFKSALHNEETKFTSHAAEMVEKVKIISSGEMIREIYKVIENGDKQSIVLRLVPKELGAVKIMLDTIDNVLTAKVEVENETVGQIIRNNVDQLKHSLLQSGVHVNSINISYQNSDQKQHGFNNHKRKNPAYQQENEIEELDETIVTKKFGYSTYEFLA
jgi:hypothetical protein